MASRAQLFASFGLGIALFATPALADESVWLSSLDLARATQGYGAPRADRSVDNHPLTLNGRVYERGFGTHSPGLLMVDLKGAATRFHAVVGIDDEVGAGKGSAEFQVLGPDGKTLWSSGVLHQGDAAKEADVDLTGLRRIALRVTTGGDDYNFDHADWADARIVTNGPRPAAVAITGVEPVIAMGPAPARPHINPPSVVGVFPGTPLIWTVPVSGARPLRFTATGLPAGVTLDPRTGTLTGRLERPGTYAFKVRVANRAGADEATVRIVAGRTLVQTPSLGWNSYDCFGDDVVEAEILENARYVAEKMQPYGWDTVVVDYRWYDPGASLAPNNTYARANAELTMDAYGRLLPSPNRFPSGFKALADKVHALGLRFGIHIMRGIPRNAVKANLPIEGTTFHATDAANTADPCSWCPDMYGVRGATEAGKAYYASLFRLYASWGVDYVKMDDTSQPYHNEEIEAVRSAIDACGRSIVYSLSPGETPVDQAEHVKTHANLWRVSGDFWDEWGALNHEFTLAERWHPHAAPGHWPDADMLPLGHLSVRNRSVGDDRRTRFTKNEQVTLLSLWCLLPSPLMVGAHLPDNDPWTLALLTNPEVLAVSQDSLGAAATPVRQTDTESVWKRRLADGSWAIGLFNRGDFAQEIGVDLTTLGLSGRFTARDLWQRKAVKAPGGRLSATIQPHGALLLRLTPPGTSR